MPPSSSATLYYGWVLVATLALTELISWGVLFFAFPALLPAMRADLGWSRSELTGALSLALLLAGIAAVPVGRWLDRHGPRLLMTVGSGVAALLVLAWSQTSSMTMFYLVWAGIGLTMATVFYEPAFVVMTTWFTQRRGLALSILTSVGGLASIVFIPLTDWLARAHGWRTTLVILATVLAVGTMLPHALLLRRRPADLGLLPDGATTASVSVSPGPPRGRAEITIGGALRSGSFWWLSAAFFLNMLAIATITIHLIPYLRDEGFSASFAATATGLIGLVALPGRLIASPLGTWLPRSVVTALIFILQAIALVVLLIVVGRIGVLLFVALFGITYGASLPLRAALLADRFGPTHYGAIAGAVAAAVTAARAAAPVGASALAALLGGYRPVLWGLVVASSLAAVAVLLSNREASPPK